MQGSSSKLDLVEAKLKGPFEEAGWLWHDGWNEGDMHSLHFGALNKYYRNFLSLRTEVEIMDGKLEEGRLAWEQRA